MTSLIRIGNGMGIRVPKDIIKQAQLEGKELEFNVTDDGLLIRPVQGKSERGRRGLEKDLRSRALNENRQELRDVPMLKDKDWEW